MNDLIRAGALSRLDLARLVTSEDEFEEGFDEDADDAGKPVSDEEGDDDVDMGGWEN